MAGKFVITGGKELNGSVEISGAKNSAGPILAATLLSKEPFIIDNLPLVEDVLKMLEMMKSMGARIDWLGEKKVRIETGDSFNPANMDSALAKKMRLSVLLIGPLSSRFKEFQISPPGGDRIMGMVRVRGGTRMGLRPITTHLEALGQMGLEYKREGNAYYFKTENLKPGKVVLKEFSVTATENLMMVAAGLDGETIIKGAAAEPHVRALGKMLQKMGAKIEGIGTHSLRIKGTRELKGVEYRVIPDHLEIGTFFVAGAITNGTLEIKNLIWDDLDIFLAKMEEIGVCFERKKESLMVSFSPNLSGVRIQTLPWPGFPTDLLPLTIPLLTQACGRSLVHDPLYENRLGFLRELKKMGADIEIVDPHRAFIFGKTSLFGVSISSWDIRAGASLLIAALAAKGETIIENVNQIDRGYEKIDEKLRRLGADIERINF